MSVRKEERRSGARLVIDFQYVARDGRKVRYRRDAQVQTMTAARAEERRLMTQVAEFGEPFEPAGEVEGAAEEASGAAGMTFAEVVAEYRATYMVTDLKVTTRRGYVSVLEGTLLPRFGELRVNEVDGAAAAELDLEQSKRGLSRGTRNNTQAVLRSVLRFAVSRGFLEERPANLPQLKPVEPSILEIPSDAEVSTILATATDAHRRSFVSPRPPPSGRPSAPMAGATCAARACSPRRRALGGFVAAAQ
ncbi:hypothetical protein [Polyangium sp. 15x6]|uniref:hypothetical protein n=1 Tax=Polyangium sp. 15x6 TaxID=3042687 RepID=UPI00249AA5A2|nr:hypothetical protein [Polyangium sp. 15x6]MDI3291002.1 hypothetical protein [Polyangium sp. 15x6]